MTTTCFYGPLSPSCSDLVVITISHIDTVVCPNSGISFGAGEQILTVEYFERLSGRAVHDACFKFRPELGSFIVPALMLRGGGSKANITLCKTTPTLRTAPQHEFYELEPRSLENILTSIKDVFKDNLDDLS